MTIGLVKISFHSSPKRRAVPKMFKLLYNCAHLTVCELRTSRFRKGRRTRDKIADIHWIIEKARKFQKNIYICFIDNAKAFDCVDHNKLWKILIDFGIPDHLTSLLRNLYAGQETTVRTLYGATDWFKIEKEVCQGCLLSACLTYMLEHIMRNTRLDELQAGIKISGKNNNLRVQMIPL